MKHGEIINNINDEEFIPLNIDKLKTQSCTRQFCDYNNLRYVGWNKNFVTTNCLNNLFSQENINMISKKITELTMGIGENDRPIIVPNSTICSVMSEVQSKQRPKVGDIYSRYIIPDSGLRDDVQEIIDKTIEIIYSDIKNSMGMEKCNSELNIWDTVYGEGNPRGLQAIPHGYAKISHKRPRTMFFFSNY